VAGSKTVGGEVELVVAVGGDGRGADTHLVLRQGKWKGLISCLLSPLLSGYV
jgi:hypothetical protein